MGARVTTSTGSYTNPVATREWADSFADRTLQSNIAEKSLSTVLPLVLSWKLLRILGVLGADIRTRSFASHTPKWWHGSVRGNIDLLRTLRSTRSASCRVIVIK